MEMTQEVSQELNCNTTSSQEIFLTQALIYIPIFCFGVILNALALKIFCCTLSKWTETRVYMTNLAIADFLLLFTLPFKMAYKTINVTTLCLAFESAYFINRYMSIFLITITAVDRYIAIKYPLKARHIRSPLKSAVISGFLWALIISIVYVTKKFEKRASSGTCFRRISREPSMYVFASVIWGFFIPLTIFSFCSIQITKKLMKKKKTNPYEEKRIQKAINIIFANMSVFVICFLPIHFAYLIRSIADFAEASCTLIEKIDNFTNLAGIIANTNCCLDAICYYFVNKEFQEASMKLKTKYLTQQKQGTEDQDLKTACPDIRNALLNYFSIQWYLAPTQVGQSKEVAPQTCAAALGYTVRAGLLAAAAMPMKSRFPIRRTLQYLS
ncbi:G35-likeprotein coupled receptor 35-like [Podarcis lilfordi]|uniref:G35-likeprotein coupled receptor 35-like n=1 Tax=Podarcis lilfordi TaxID=74358 RepID=A0AA35P7Y3_9SAUR|nr:G35-likeprotein coupled receptor 35-like [Podarcis lilfordi]